MLEQFSREWLQIYPQARVLAASSEDLAGERRRQFVARVAANDWDAVIMTRSAFTRLAVAPDTEAAYERQQVEQLRGMLDRAKGDRGLTVKVIEKQIARREQKLKAVLDSPRDPGISFEATGIDYLLVDEAHEFKNLQTDANIRDAAITGSKRASDLHMKLEYLRSRHGARIATLATATPIANSITEAHVMSRYLRPDLLRTRGRRGLRRVGGDVRPDRDRDRSRPRQERRLPDAHPVRALSERPRDAAASGTCSPTSRPAEDLQLPVPQLAERQDGQRAPRAVLIEPSPELALYVEQLGERADKVRGGAVDPTEDNMLKITGDGRKAALDMRLVTGQPRQHARQAAGRRREHRPPLPRHPRARVPRPDHRRAVAAARCAADRVLRPLHPRARGGTPTSSSATSSSTAACPPRRSASSTRRATTSRRPGCSPPAAPATSACSSARRRRWAWAPTSRRARSRCTTSTVPGGPPTSPSVTGGSCGKATRTPPSAIYRYVVEGSFDSYSWQTVERKARFINQLMRGRLDVREIEDLSDDVIGFAELKAIASGDPLILEKAKIDAELERLKRLERAWQRGHHALRSTIAAGEERARARDRQIAAIHDVLPGVRDTRGDLFTMTIGGRSYTHRTDAAGALAAHLATIARGPARPVAELAGLQIDAELRRRPRRQVLPSPSPPRPASAARHPGARAAPRRRALADPPARAPRPSPSRARREARS